MQQPAADGELIVDKLRGDRRHQEQIVARDTKTGSRRHECWQSPPKPEPEWPCYHASSGISSTSSDGLSIFLGSWVSGSFRRRVSHSVDHSLCVVYEKHFLTSFHSGLRYSCDSYDGLLDTEIDFTTYMRQVDVYLAGERDYSLIKGPSGPLVYVSSMPLFPQREVRPEPRLQR